MLQTLEAKWTEAYNGSVDKLNMPNALSEAPSRVLNRPGSRARTPSLSSGLAGSKPSLSKTDIDLDKRLEALDDTKANGGLPNLQPGSGELTYRGPNQEIAHIGTIPKRTESMYFKPLIDEDSNTKVCKVKIIRHFCVREKKLWQISIICKI